MTYIVQPDPVGVKGSNGTDIAAPDNPLDVQGLVHAGAITWSVPDAVLVTDPEDQLLAAAGGAPRAVLIKVASSAANGIRFNIGGAATVNKFSIEPGDPPLMFMCNDEIRAIRDGGVDVLVSVATGVPA